ncbi:uncharacterized protein [Macrobrachium rosenbergii]|uniref:uncharacterized protein n=1 Tax=Macrobrachium rosenbergii TaxID=79674 RepID=UPI0034D6C92D
MEEASTASCAEVLLSSWISRFGVPDSIITDRDPAFLSELWVSLACLMVTTLHSTTAYNPAANGMVERVHRSLKAALMACCTDDRWKEQLSWVLLVSAPHRRQMAMPPLLRKSKGRHWPSPEDSSCLRLMVLTHPSQG